MDKNNYVFEYDDEKSYKENVFEWFVLMRKN